MLCDGPWSLASHNKFRCQMNNEQHQWRCMHCDRSFKSHLCLNMHKNIHKGLKPYICKICGKAFYSPKTRRRHYSRHYFPEAQFCQCPTCGKTISNRCNLRRHQIAVHGATKGLKCPKCRKTFTVHGDLRMHQRHCCLSGKEFQCVRCEKHYASLKSLRKHERAFHRDIGLKCGTCGKHFRKKENLVKHEFLHNSGTPFKCDFCGLCFFSGVGLANHLRIHTSKERSHRKLHECLKCKTKYTSHKGLRNHYRKFHPDLHVKSMSKRWRNTNRCQKCSLTFYNHSNLVRHMRELHPKQKIFKCSKCQMIFVDKCRLASHCASHAEKRGAVKRVTPPRPGTAKKSRFPCSICKKRFSSVSLMRMHKKTHFRSGLRKRYTCVRCASRFTDLVSLGKHRKRCAKTKRSTDDQDPLVNTFRCKQCGMTQLSYTSLCEHMQIHGKTSDNDVQSNVSRNTLDSSCASACSFSKNPQSFVKNEGFTCSVCNKAFLNKESLNGHMSHHSRNTLHSSGASLESFVSRLSKSPPLFSENKGFSCNVCNKSFPSKGSLKSHKSHHSRSTLHSSGASAESSVGHFSKSPPSFPESMRFNCSVCNKSFLRKESLNGHMSHHSRNTFYCSGASLESSVGHLSKSPPSFPENKGFSCSVCNKSFLRKESLNGHMSHHSRNTLHSSGTSLESSVGRLSKSPSSFAENKGFSCNVCNKSFLSKGSLKSHKSHHSRSTLHSSGASLESSVGHLSKSPPSFPENKGFSCSVCKKSFLRKESLNGHMSQHSRSTLHSLSAASSSPSLSRLSKSPLSFLESKRFHCSVCSKSFLSKESLNGHMSHHSRNSLHSSGASLESSVSHLQNGPSSFAENKGFSCSVCNKSFLSKGSLKSHKSHHGRNTFHFIGSSSGSSGRGLRKSPRLLSESKGFKCNLLANPHHTKGSLNVHRSRHFRNSLSTLLVKGLPSPSENKQAKHGSRSYGRYKCWHCEKTLVTRSGLRRHLKRHQAKPLHNILVQRKEHRVGGCTSLKNLQCEDRFSICGKTVENEVRQCPQNTSRLIGSSSSHKNVVKCDHCYNESSRMAGPSAAAAAAKGTLQDGAVRKLQLPPSKRQQKRLNCSRNVSGVTGRKMALNAFCCHYCDKGFFTLSKRYQHIMVVHSKDFGLFPIAPYSDQSVHFENSSGILKEELCSGDAHLQCYDCNSLFCDDTSLDKHLSTAHSKMSSKYGKGRLCATLYEQREYYGNRCSSQGDLDGHIKSCQVKRSDSSLEPPESTFLSNNTCHSTSCVQHPGDKRLQCHYCEKWFSNVSNRYRHVRNVHKKKRRSRSHGSSGGLRCASGKSSLQRCVGDLKLSLDNSSGLSSVTKAKRACPITCADVGISSSKRLKGKHPNPKSKTGNWMPSADNGISPSSRIGLRSMAFKCEYCVKRFFTLSGRFRHLMLAHSSDHTSGTPEVFDSIAESNRESVQSEDDNVKFTFVKCRATTNQRKPVKLLGRISSEDAGSFPVVQLSSLVSDCASPLFQQCQPSVPPYKCHVCKESFAAMSSCKRHIRRNHRDNVVSSLPSGTDPCRQALRTISGSLPNSALVETTENVRLGHDLVAGAKEVSNPSVKLKVSFSKATSPRQRAKTNKTRLVRFRYQCDLCNYTSYNKRDVEHHKRSIHCRERPFKCKLCSFSCSRKDNLYVHIRLHLQYQRALESTCN